MDRCSLHELKVRASSGEAQRAEVHAQVEAARTKLTRQGSEFLELRLSDSRDSLILRLWSDSAAFAAARDLPAGAFVAVQGEWTNTAYGLDPGHPSLRVLTDEEVESLLSGPPELAEKQARDFAFLLETAHTLNDPRLRALCVLFLEEHGDRFRRTAAAREYHHARRGGLVEHTAQMTRSALALAPVYPQINRDLLVAGVLFHDSGKLWENCYDSTGFTMPYHLAGELLGHIPVGIELVNRLWHRIMESAEAAAWQAVDPPAETVRLHLLHLIGSHHGDYQFGSPVLPRTPEAILLHHIDNIDARLEMMADAYASSPLVAPGIHERRRPLPTRVVRSLPSVPLPDSPAEDES